MIYLDGLWPRKRPRKYILVLDCPVLIDWNVSKHTKSCLNSGNVWKVFVCFSSIYFCFFPLTNNAHIKLILKKNRLSLLLLAVGTTNRKVHRSTKVTTPTQQIDIRNTNQLSWAINYFFTAIVFLDGWWLEFQLPMQLFNGFQLTTLWYMHACMQSVTIHCQRW